MAPKIRHFHDDDPDDLDGIAQEVNEETQRGIGACGSWRAEARTALRYYRSDQYRLRKGADLHRIRMVANFVRRDADKKVNSILDSEPIITPRGRRPKFQDMAQMLIQILDWTRDEEENYEADLEDGTTDCVHMGEGVLYEGWNQDADEGRGMPETKWFDSRYVVWDDGGRDWQRDDVEFVVVLEHLPTKRIQKMWDLEDEPEAEGLELFLTSAQMDRLAARTGGASNDVTTNGVKKAWVKRRWKKRKKYELKFFQSGEPAQFEEGGDQFDMTPQQYDELSPDQQVGILQISIPEEELWETVVCGDEVLEHHISPFCATQGGHGLYPFGFFQGIRLRDESRARGEIGFLIGVSDVRNEVISMMLDQAFLANSGYMGVVAGSMDPNERKKVNQIGRRFPLVIETLQGMPGPSWQGINPSGTNVFQQILPIIDSIQDRESGHGPFDRGELVSQEYSGRAIRAIQAAADQLGVALRKHIESGMKRITLLRLHNISQFMRGNRVADIVNKDTGKEESIYIGDNAMEIMVTHGLEESQDPLTGEPILLDPQTGEPARILALNDDVTRENIFNKIRLKLDTDREKNKVEREEDAREVLAQAGPGALNWFLQQKGLDNEDTLMGDLEKYNKGLQYEQRLTALQEQYGADPEAALEMLEQAFAGGGQQITQQPAMGGTPIVGQPEGGM
jgi:hypothetical protein